MTKRGVPCRAFAGQGTDHLGSGRCKYHGGSTASHKKHAAELEARKQMVALGAPIDEAQPHQVLLGLLRASAGHISWLHAEIAAMDDLSSRDSQIKLRLYDEERDRATRIATACSTAGVEQASIRFAEAQAHLLARAVHSAAQEIGLRRTQLAALGTALRKHLAELAGDDETADREAAILEERVEKVRTDHERQIERAAGKRPPPDVLYPPDEWVPDEPSARETAASSLPRPGP